MSRSAIVPERRATRIGAGRLRRSGLIVATLLLAGCYPRYDWRDYRADCARTWCGFVVSFPGRASTATRDIPVGATALPLALHVVTIGDVTFAVGAFELRDSDPAAARAVFEKKLLSDVGATDAIRGTATVRSIERAAIPAATFEADGRRDGTPLHASARFVERAGRLVEIVVIGPSETLSSDRGRQAVETFVSSLQLD